MNWPFIFGALLVFFSMCVTMGAWHGYFSPEIRVPKYTPEVINLEEQKKQLEETVAVARDRIFRYENDTSEYEAKIRDLQEAMQALMDQINQLTQTISTLQDENSTLKKGLKEALEALDITRKQLMECKTYADAKRLAKQYCDVEPASNMLF